MFSKKLDKLFPVNSIGKVFLFSNKRSKVLSLFTKKINWFLDLMINQEPTPLDFISLYSMKNEEFFDKIIVIFITKFANFSGRVVILVEKIVCYQGFVSN